MFEEIERLTRALCAEHGTSGCEGDVFKGSSASAKRCVRTSLAALWAFSAI